MNSLKSISARLALFACLSVVFGCPATAQEKFDVRANYRKHEQRIPMRDGVKLFTSVLVRGEPMRARFRNSWERPEALVPNRATKVAFVMPDTSHTFRKGHRIMVQLQSSWFPLVDRNPQKFVNIYNPQKFVNIYEARDSDFQRATQRIYRDGPMASHVKLTVLP
jgi:predicted acyl esterase